MTRTKIGEIFTTGVAFKLAHQTNHKSDSNMFLKTIPSSVTLLLFSLIFALLTPFNIQVPVAQALSTQSLQQQAHAGLISVATTSSSSSSSNNYSNTNNDPKSQHPQSIIPLAAAARKYVKLGNNTRSSSSIRAFNPTATSNYHYFNSHNDGHYRLQGQLNASWLHNNPATTNDLLTINKLVAIDNFLATTGQQQQQQQQQHNQKRVGLLDKICIGTSNRMSGQHNKTDHYQNLAERYRNCTYVIGNLEITWLDKGATDADDRPVDLSFLESIREITGYLLIAYVEVDKIRMPDLQIIRGRDLFKLNSDQKEEFAIILIENELKTLELPNLREILAGSVGSYNNRNLCHIRTINWDEILNWPMYRSVFVYNGTEPECPPCDGSCQGSCWGEGPEMCQKFSKTNCSPQCSQGRCFGPSAAECCHSFCAGGCTGPKQTDCLACKNFYDDGECIQECPSMMRYNPSKFLWETNPNGKYAFGATCVKECPEHLLRDNGACVRTCPPNKRSVNGECVPCGGPCPKNCQGVEVVHSGNIDQLINCTVIEGSITILDTSFTGYAEVYSNNTIGTKYKPMHPNRLEVFKTLREITGYLNIQANHSDFKNLSYFRNLKIIGGRQTTDMFYALSIIKTSLISLNLCSLRKVRSGRITIEENVDLCFADTIDWMQINITRREDITTRNNAESSKCRQLGLQCHEQCAQDGCWGPGPDECLSCNNYKLDDYCVDNCTSIQTLGFLSYDSGGRTCKKCHSECKGGCNGTEAINCWDCKNVKDGPYCVAECPSHKYKINGICEECDKSCIDGCSGPSNKLGDGGCNSCGKAIINSTEPTFMAHCIRAEEPCPEGYYQEYVGPQAEGPLKSSSGKPVCRKCHHRCKSCTGMGTHISVCECAKYVAGEQCEDYCPRDYFADEQLRHCVKCSPECNGCFGPTEADCVTCRVYRIYYDNSSFNGQIVMSAHETVSKLQHGVILIAGSYDNVVKQQVKFNCTAQCPPDKPHKISESNMLDPYCSEDPGIDLENPRIVSLGSTSVLFMLIISVAIMFCVSVYRCQIENDKTVKLTMHLSGIDDVEPLNPSNMKPNLAPLRSIKETELRKGNILGSGFGGTVYQGFWFPEGQEHKEPRPVAIKVLRDNGQSNMNKEFLDEAYIMASVNHPNLVRLLAVCMTPNHLMLVTQLMPLGCLLEYVKKYKNDVGSKNLLEWCKQIAKGMAYLEDHRMVHRDLALRNVLLQTSGRALISDFGLAKFLELDQSEYHSGGGRLPIKWLAPECIRERKFTHKSDVWAFGVTVWELLTFGMRPFEEYDTKDILMAIEKGARLHQPNYMSAEVYKVMYACWFYNPDDRPNFRGLAQNFVNFARDPERYLIRGTKGIEYSIRRKLIRGSESDENGCEDYGSDVNSLVEEESQPPMSTMPVLTPSTHNRLNEMFGFELRHHSHHLHQHHHSESEDGGHGQHLSTPTLKKMFHSNNGHQLIGTEEIDQAKEEEEDEDVFCLTKRNQTQISTKASLITDANNNNFIQSNNRLNSNVDSCWSMHHTISTNSLGQKTEQPTDVYDYLLPSPCTDERSHFSTFYASSYDPKSTPITPTTTSTSATVSIKNPPHSAGLIGVNNEEYFMTRVSYVNQKSSRNSVDGGIAQQQLSTSNDIKDGAYTIDNWSVQKQEIGAGNFKTNYDRAEIKPTKKRYLILLLFCLHSMINAAQWIYLSSIANIVAKYYQVDNMAINWTSMVYMLVYIPLVVPASWLFERIGMRNSILLGSVGTTLGSMLKCFSCHQDRFILLMSGQTIVAICQLFVLSVPPRLASVWFPDNQVSLANACGVFSNQFGIALGFVVPQLVIGDVDQSEKPIPTIESGLFNLFVCIALVSAFISILIISLFDKTPSKPPGLARLQQIKQETALAEAGTTPLVKDGNPQYGFGSLLWDLFTDKNFVLLMISYGLLVGVFYAISTVLNQMIVPIWPNDASTLAGRLGLVMVISGMFGSIISGYILDKTHMYRLINTSLYSLSLLAMILFAVTLKTDNIVALYLTVALLGYFMTGYLLIGYEMSNEITWPRPESLSAGLLNLSAQVFGVILTYVGTSIVDNLGNLTANIFFTTSILVGLMVTVMIKAQLKRQNAIDT